MPRSALFLILDCFNCLSLGQNLANHGSWVKSSPLPIIMAHELRVFFTFLKSLNKTNWRWICHTWNSHVIHMSIDKVLLGHNPTHSFTYNLAAFMLQLLNWSLAIETIWPTKTLNYLNYLALYRKCLQIPFLEHKRNQ